MIKYKLTNQNLRTYDGHKWKIGVEQVIEKPGTKLCSDQVFHYYDSPELAILLNPIHADIKNPRLWEVECDQVIHDGTKGGAKKMRFVRELPIPQITTEQTVKFGILCAKKVYFDEKFLTWADNWLSGKDRSANAAWATAKTAADAAAAWAWAAARWAWVWAAAWAAAMATEVNKNIDLIAIAHEACACK